MRFSTLFLGLVALTPLVAALPADESNWLSIEKRASVASSFKICDLSRASLPPAPTALPPPSEGLTLAHVAVGRGTQNYTCDTSAPSSAPKAAGAMASLFNVTCAAAASQRLVSSIPKYALKYAIPTSSNMADPANTLLSGHHEFTNLTTPFFTFKTPLYDYGSVHCAKTAASNAPADAPKGVNGLGSVPWLKLTGFDGDYKEIYRVDTAGGVAPKTCDGQQASFQVEYSATYYFYKQA